MTMQATRATTKEAVPGIPSRLPALAGEMFGTFVLVLSGTATLLATARIAHSTTATVDTQIAVSVAFGFGILAAVYTVATVSGAHINPAVTFGLAAAREFPWRLVPAYWAAQLLGGILAALVNWGIFGDKLGSALDLGTTRPGPGGSLIAALLAEFVLTAVLLIVVMSTAVYQRAPGGAMPAGLAVGLWIGCAVFLGILGRMDLPDRPTRGCRVRRVDLAVPQAGTPAGQRGRTRNRTHQPGRAGRPR